MQIHCNVQRVTSSHGAPVPVSQPQHWANTNRLSFITVWQKHTRLEKNPPKTNHTELRDNPEPKHQRETGGHCFIYHPTRIHPEEKQRDEMRRHCPTLPAQEKQDLISVDWVDCLQAKKRMMLVEQTVALFVYVHGNVFCLLLYLEADKCVKKLARVQFYQWWALIGSE